MALTKKGNFSYGDEQSDIREYITEFSKANGYVATHFADATCKCGGKTFRIGLDDNEGAAERLCALCNVSHPMCDSADYLAGANLDECACPCGAEIFEATVGVSLYADSEDVRWLYLGLRCPSCKLTAVYGDWKNEYPGYTELLNNV